mmetsp:Transcript_43663/g.105531  ORF Transcript_43663/g.105531 Transcript_43663/m.105531 type:complete len:928 (+) Transcript_43663:22-2805(+)
MNHPTSSSSPGSSKDASVGLNQRPVTLEEVEACLNISKHAMWFADFDPSNRRLLWSNSVGLKMNHKKNNDEFRSIDIVTGTSKKRLEQQDNLYQEVQVDHKRYPETHITLYPGGVPTPASFDAVPVLANFPWMPEPKVLCLIRAEPIVAKKQRSKVDDDRNRAIEILSYSAILTLLFSEEGALLQFNRKASFFYGKHVDLERCESSGEEAPALKLSLEQLLESCVWESDEDRSSALAQIQGLYRTTQTLQLKVMKKHVNKKGKQIWHAMTFIACYDPVTGKAAMLVNEADITDLKEMSFELVEAQKAREAFFTAISHELRTPLNGIIGLATSLLDEEETPAATRGKLSVINATGRRLAGLVGDILDASEIREGNVSFQREKVSLYDAAAHAIEALAPLARKEVEMENKVPHDLLVEGDSDRIVQCLMNLVGNSLRFTRWGSIRISGERFSSSSVVLKVSDTGSGIPSDKLDTLFVGPQRMSKETAKLVGLSGLGLPLVKGIVEGHCGTIDVTSSAGVGTEFRIVLPMRQNGGRMTLNSNSASGGASFDRFSFDGDEAFDALEGSQNDIVKSANGDPNSRRATSTSPLKATSPLTRTSSHSSSQRRRDVGNHASVRAHVLVVDNDAISSLVTERLLEQAGFKTTTKSSGEEAISFVLSEEPPDLIMVAAAMTEMDGMEMTRLVREVYRSEDLPIILMVGDTPPGSLDMEVPFGVDEVIHTPINKSELDLRVKLLIRLKEMNGFLAAGIGSDSHESRQESERLQSGSFRTLPEDMGMSVKQPLQRRVSQVSDLSFAPNDKPDIERYTGFDDNFREIKDAFDMCADLRAQMAMQQLEASKRERKLMRELNDRAEEIEKLRIQSQALEGAMQPLNMELQVEKDMLEQTIQQLEEKRTAVWDLETRMGAAARNHKFGLELSPNRDQNGGVDF